MERASNERLQELKDQGIPVYSISRLDSINNCLYGAYMTYVLGRRGMGNVYSYLGSASHDCLEGITLGTKTEADLLPAIHAELENLDLLGIDFPKDRNGGDSIRQGWITNMEHFATTYKAPKSKTLIAEELILYQTPNGNWLQGYIDLQNINSDGTVSIYDYKTSSMYSKNELLEHGRQLVLYALGLESRGLNVRDVQWIMLKYVDIEYVGFKSNRAKNKTTILKTIERRKIGSELENAVESALLEANIDEIETQFYLDEFKRANKFDCLPEVVRNQFKMKPCVMKYELTDEVRKECIEYIDNTIKKWESLTKDNDLEFPPRSFTKLQKNGKEVEDTFFCNCLCDHAKECRYIIDYNNTRAEKPSEEDDLF